MRFLVTLLLGLSLAGAARAAGDAAEGRKLVEENRCEACHHNKTLGDAKAVYLRQDRKVTSLEKLKAQVALCNSELGLKLFPEDEENIVAFLDATYYRFSSSRSSSK
jgi:cytochrome c2